MTDTSVQGASGNPREPITPQRVADVSEFQLLEDRLRGGFHGLWQYVMDHLPEHENKDAVLTNLKAGYDNTVKVLRDEAAKAVEQARQDTADTVRAVEAGPAGAGITPTTAATAASSSGGVGATPSAPAVSPSTGGSTRSEVPPTS